MHAADRDFVDQGHERVVFAAGDQQDLARPPQTGRKMPEQRGPGEPGAENDHARAAPDAHATRHPRKCLSGTSLSLSLRPASQGSISSGTAVLGETLYKTRART